MKFSVKENLRNWQQHSLLSGTILLFVSMTIVNGGNYVLNLLLGRWLGPAAFADLSLMVTLLLMVTFITVTFQLTAAKFAAAYTVAGDNGRLQATHSWLRRQAWQWGGLLLGLLVLGAPLWQQFFKTQSAWPFIILGLGLPIYLVQGVDRGILQGQTRFGRLAVSYQAEMLVRLCGGLLLVWLGWGVNGAVLAMSLSFLATWLVANDKNSLRRLRSTTNMIKNNLSLSEKQTIVAFSWPVIVAQLSQILINNSDILIVKRFFAPAEAGQYAALALIGRMVFFATWSVVTTLFPIVAQKQEQGLSHRHLLAAGLGLVGIVSAAIIFIVWWQPDFIVSVLFGADYLTIAPLLWLYAIATAVYALGNVIINYRLSANNSLGTYLGVIAGILQVIGLTLWHDSLQQVILVQIGLMGLLLLALLLWDTGLQIMNRSGKVWLRRRQWSWSHG